jgi:LysM repeat protein
VAPARREQLERYAAPAAFLAAVTVAVLLIKSGLNGGNSSNTESTLPTAVSVTTRAQTTRATTTAAARYYTIQSGDTLGVVAARQNTTVADLLRLNPGVDPTTLHVGQRIRVG